MKRPENWLRQGLNNKMGKWAENEFGQSKFSDVGIVVAGTMREEFEKEILGLFDKVLSKKDSVYHSCLVQKGNEHYPVVFNVYGAPAMMDVITLMHDGGCRTIIFVGYAYGGLKNLEIGNIVIPDKAYHFEGIYHHIEPDKKASLPDMQLKRKIEEILKKSKIKYTTGTNISVPAVTFQLPHNNLEYKKISPDTVEMELAACLSRAKDIGIRASGILIISDNKKLSIGDITKRKLRHDARLKVLKEIVNNISHLKLPKLKIKKEFNRDEYLASIIDDPEDKTNVYRA